MGARITDKQWNALSTSCKRELMNVIMIVETDNYIYSLGTDNIYWIMFRRDREGNVEKIDKWL